MCKLKIFFRLCNYEYHHFLANYHKVMANECDKAGKLMEELEHKQLQKKHLNECEGVLS